MSKFESLFSRNRLWADRIKEINPDFFENLSKQQKPELLWIGCADSRVPANQIIDLQPGDVFVHRNIANVVVPSDLNCLSVIQFAVEVLEIRHIVVCGHYGCGGVKASLSSENHGLIDNWLRHIRNVKRLHTAELEELPDEDAVVDRLCELNVVEQVHNVCATTIVRDAWRRGVDLHVGRLGLQHQERHLEKSVLTWTRHGRSRPEWRTHRFRVRLMYVRHSINARHLFHDSWLFLILAAAWSLVVVYVNEFQGYHVFSIPIAPVTTIGIAVSLYLGFKSTSAYNRWWEARKIWGDIINRSRDWGNSVFNLIVPPEGKTLDPAIRKELIERHLAWVNALAYQLRRTSRLKEATSTHVFGHRRVFSDSHFHQTPDSYWRYLSAEEVSEVDKYNNVATHLLRRQGDRLRELAEEGFLGPYRHVAMMTILGAFYDTQGKCERIKNTPFPRQVADFGLMFTWVFIFLLPLSFVEIFDAQTEKLELSEFLAHEFMLTMVPFTVLISWVFFIMEKVSDSTEDPFEGGVTDVPISSLCRVIEIDLKQMLEAEEVPEPLKPVDGVLY